MRHAVYGQQDKLPYVPSVLCKWARQLGKNETAARFDIRFLTLYGEAAKRGRLPMPLVRAVYGAPGYLATIGMAKERLKEKFNELKDKLELDKFRFVQGVYANIDDLPAQIGFVSVTPGSQIVGQTAHAFIRLDETQDVDKHTWDVAAKAFAATTAAPVFYQGTGGVQGSFMETVEEQVQELEEKFRRRGFPLKLYHRIPWEVGARYNPSYDKFVRQEREALGETSDAFRMNYAVENVRGSGTLLTDCDLRNLVGDHERRSRPESGKIYVGGLDYCGVDEEPTTEGGFDPDRADYRDSTSISIGELTFVEREDVETGLVTLYPVVRKVDMALWPGYVDTDEKAFDFLFNLWRCVYVCEDANGVGNVPSAKHEKRRPSQVKRVFSTPADNTRMGDRLVNFVRSAMRRFQVFRDDGSEDWKEMMLQYRCLEKERRSASRMSWGHPSRKALVDGRKMSIHDDIPKADALMLEAASVYHMQKFSRIDQPKKKLTTWDESAGYPVSDPVQEWDL